MFKLIIRADLVPEGATVTQVSGTKKYTVRNTLRIYSEDPAQRREITCEDDYVFLVDTDGNATVCRGAKEVCWHTTGISLLNMLQTTQAMREPL